MSTASRGLYFANSWLNAVWSPSRNLAIRSKVEVKGDMPLPNGDYAAKYTVSPTESSSDTPID